MKLKNSGSELEKLKKLLLSDELEKLIQLESRLKELTLQSNDEEVIAAKIIPLFDKILLERLKSKDQNTITILSDHLAKIIAQTSQRNPEALSHSLQSVLASAISEEIASNKDVMIDSLYPIMGGMISKYITAAIKELMENINERIDNGLSLDRYKRKIKSRITGVSETELLLEESSDAHILSLFVIQKKSGLLISEANLKDKEINDPHMVASMASAIKDFINDWAEGNKESAQVQLVSYGSSTLYIESAGSVYLIAFLDAEPDQEQRMKINRFFASVIKEYMKFFQKFDGDDSSKEVKSLNGKIQNFLDIQNKNSAQGKKKSKSNFTQYIAIFLAVLLFVGIGYWAKDKLIEYQIKKEIFVQTGYKITIDIDNDHITAKGSVESFSDLYTLEKIIKAKSQLKIINYVTMPMAQIGIALQEEEKSINKSSLKLTERIKELEKELADTKQSIDLLSKNLSDRSDAAIKRLKEADQSIKILSETLNDKNDELKKEQTRISARKKEIDRLINLKEDIDTQLKNKFEDNPYFNPKNKMLIFSNHRFFHKGKEQPGKNAQKIIIQNVDEYVTVLMGNPKTKRYLGGIIIKGHTDSDGKPEYNMQLSKERAEAVKEILSKMEIIRKNNLLPLLASEGYGDQYRIMINGAEDKNASRRIEIEFQFDDKRIGDDIKELIKNFDK